ISGGKTDARVNGEALAKLRDGIDGFILKTVDGNLYIDGKTDRGILYGAYEFLERVVGVRFFTPEETLVPKRDGLQMPDLDVVSEPDFAMRTYLTYPVYKMNPDLAFTARTRTLHNWFHPEEKYGGKTKVYCRYDGAHNARMFVPAEKYGVREINGDDVVFAEDHEAHPEFYVYTDSPASFNHNGGIRKWSKGLYQTINWAHGITADGKLDETMDLSVAKIVVEEMKKDVLANPYAEYFLFTQEDCIDPVTDKALLEKYKASGVIIRFCNVIATELQRWSDKELGGRKINIVTFAYNQTQEAPVYLDEATGKYMPIDETVIPVDNLYIYLAYGCFPYCAIDDPRQPDLAKLTHLKWGAICKKFWFWSYDAVYTDFFTYNHSFGMIDGTLKMLKELGVEFVMLESSHNCVNDWQSYMKHYVWINKLWDITRDTQALKDEYIDNVYGIAAGGVREMMKLYEEYYEEILRKNPQLFLELGPYKEIGTVEYIEPSLMERAIAIIEREEKRVQAEILDKDERARLLKRLAGVKLTPLWMKLKHYDALYAPSAKDAQAEKYALGVEVLNLARLAGVNVWSEKGSIFGWLYSELSIG
ncbi:MAG: DUF4838 domain-containing protein, partial [Clostridia bacterium]|nr:DUF4838 domain-containing protein [Clostridia bacterium]